MYANPPAVKTVLDEGPACSQRFGVSGCSQILQDSQPCYSSQDPDELLSYRPLKRPARALPASTHSQSRSYRRKLICLSLLIHCCRAAPSRAISSRATTKTTNSTSPIHLAQPALWTKTMTTAKSMLSWWMISRSCWGRWRQEPPRRSCS